MLFIFRLPQSSACFGELVCNVNASETGLTVGNSVDQAGGPRYTHQQMSSDLLILGSEEKTTMAVSEDLMPLACYPLQLIKASFFASGIPTGDLRSF